MKTIKLELPEFVFLDGNSPGGDTLENRTVILHVRSASVMEFFHDEVLLNTDVISKRFKHKNIYNVVEDITIALHHSPLIEDKGIILDEIINPSITWYRKYLDWEDMNILDEVPLNKV